MRHFSQLVGTNIISEFHVYISMLSYSFAVKAVTTVCGKMIYCCPQNVFGNRMFTSLGILPCINIFNLLHVGIFWLQNKGFWRLIYPSSVLLIHRTYIKVLLNSASRNFAKQLVFLVLVFFSFCLFYSKGDYDYILFLYSTNVVI